MENRYCVYCHISPSGKRYIGITCRKPERRWNNGKGYKENDYFTKAIEKYGWESFEHIILREGLSMDEASNMEIALIEKYDTANRDKGYNIDLGGHHGKKIMLEETKRKIGDAHRGKYTEAQWAATIARRGKGHPHTEEAKKKISDARRGRPLSEKQKRHLSEINKGKKMLDKTKEILREIAMHPVEQYDKEGNFVAKYPSLKDASQKTGFYYQGISACCRGKHMSCGGFVWKYAAKETDTENGVVA